MKLFKRTPIHRVLEGTFSWCGCEHHVHVCFYKAKIPPFPGLVKGVTQVEKRIHGNVARKA